MYLILAEWSHSVVLLFKRNSGTKQSEKPTRTAGDRGQSTALVQISIRYPVRVPTARKNHPAHSTEAWMRKATCAHRCSSPASQGRLTRQLPCPQQNARRLLDSCKEPYRSDTASACSSFRSTSRTSSSAYSSFPRSSASSLSTACSWAVVLASSTVTASCET